MPPPSSYISSFDGARAAGSKKDASRRPSIVATILWTICAIVVIDFVVGFVFRPPSDPRRPPSSLQAYFEYGRSIEGKLRREVGSTPAEDAPIIQSGWLAEVCDVDTPSTLGKVDFDIYGMSFSAQIADQMVGLDPTIAAHSFAGPGAPPNHSYACFLRRHEAHRKRAAIQIIGVLASSLPQMETISGLTTSFEAPAPFAYPRYSLAADGRLTSYSSSIASAEDLRSALADPTKWNAFLDELAAHDYFYSSEVFPSNLLDFSVIGRMARRAWGQSILRARTASLLPNDGFKGSPDIEPVLNAILGQFAAMARDAGERPIVILIENKDRGGVLSAMTASTLQANHIDFVATSEFVSSSDSGNFVPDGHFTPAATQSIARGVLQRFFQQARLDP